MGVLIVAGTVTLVALLVQRAGGGSGSATWEVALGQPDGARIGGVSAAEDGIAIWVQRPDGDRIVVVDPKEGRVLGEIRAGR
jgi:hypothetical protein